MKIAIMQPYFLPYIGYFQLINAVDKFIIYDNIEYTKKGWINRNRILHNNSHSYMSLPLLKDSDFLNINERQISDEWFKMRIKLLRQIYNTYKKAPFFNEIFPVIEDVFNQSEKNLFSFILYAIKKINTLLGIQTELISSSKLNINHSLRGKDKVIEICKQVSAKVYINSIGGRLLYNKREFKKQNINLLFLETQDMKYKQNGNEFIESLSIIDMLMFNSKTQIKTYLDNYKLI